MFLSKKSFFFFNIFYSFNPNHAYWNQRRLFSGNLLSMFSIAEQFNFSFVLSVLSTTIVVMGINAAISPVVVRVCFIFSSQFKELELFWAAAFFNDSQRSNGGASFLSEN